MTEQKTDDFELSETIRITFQPSDDNIKKCQSIMNAEQKVK